MKQQRVTALATLPPSITSVPTPFALLWIPVSVVSAVVIAQRTKLHASIVKPLATLSSTADPRPADANVSHTHSYRQYEVSATKSVMRAVKGPLRNSHASVPSAVRCGGGVATSGGGSAASAM
jgi:hypothetical protein